MSLIDKLVLLLSDLRDFEKNLKKDNSERRKNITKLDSDIKKLNSKKLEFSNFKAYFDAKESHPPEILEEIETYFKGIKNLIDRIDSLLSSRSKDIEDNRDIDNSSVENMGEAFDLKTASNMLPNMDNTENSVKQLIDAIELYDDLLNAEGKKMLTKYILRIKLNQAAKLRLKDSYTSNELLISDMRKFLLTKKSATTLSLEMHSLKQKNNSIEAFGTLIEEKMVNLTLAQSEGTAYDSKMLAEVNEKLAIAAFSNGLRDDNLKTIVKARNYSFLKDAICGAKEEESSNRNSDQYAVNFFRRGNRSRCNTRYFRGNQNFRGSNRQNNSRFTNTDNSNREFSRANYRNNNRRASRANRRYTRGATNSNRSGYYLGNNSSSNDETKFFRPSDEAN